MYAQLLRWVYMNIYMPLFLYISGRFSGSQKNILKKYLYPYFFWQIILLLFVRQVLRKEEPFTILTPYYHLWFLAAEAIYHRLSQRKNRSFRLNLSIAFFAAVLIGFIPWIGDGFAFSHTLCFYPFFFHGKRKMLEKKYPNFTSALAWILILLAGIWFWQNYRIPASWMHYNTPYAVNGSSPIFRIWILIVGTAWCFLLIRHILNTRIIAFGEIHISCFYSACVSNSNDYIFRRGKAATGSYDSVQMKVGVYWSLISLIRF